MQVTKASAVQHQGRLRASGVTTRVRQQGSRPTGRSSLCVLTWITLTVGALTEMACGSRTGLLGGGDYGPVTALDAGGDAPSDAHPSVDAGEPERYCATRVGAVDSCGAGPEAGYVILCKGEATCRYFAPEWGCCVGEFQGCVYGSNLTSCP